MDANDRPPAATPEEALARYRVDRDPRDLGRLFDLAAADLFRVALHLCPDAAAAEDALQETFLAVMEHPERYEPGRPARPWLGSILRHQASKGRRREGRVPDPVRLRPPGEPDDPLLRAADAEERERVRVALLGLEEPYREAALLRWRYGLEPAEIAEVKGVPPGTVSSWLHRAVEKLRVEMGALPAVLAAAFPERGLPAVKALVLKGAAGTGAGVGIGVGAAALAAGGGIVASKMILGAAGAAVAALVGWWLFSGGGAPAPAPVASAPPPKAVDATVETPPPKESPRETPRPEPKKEVLEPPAGTPPFDPAAATATLRIRARAQAALPKMRPIKFDADPKCGEQHAQQVMEETIVEKEGRLANAIAWISRGAERWTYPAPAGAALLDQRGCMYVPHVLTVRVGQPITIRNSDPVMHNIHGMGKSNAEFNHSQLKESKDLTETIGREEVGVKIKCDVHGWMGAWVGAFDHPFHGVTGADGTLDLKVPPGAYEVSAWHEYAKFGKQEPRTVTVAAEETKEIEFVFEVKLK